VAAAEKRTDVEEKKRKRQNEEDENEKGRHRETGRKKEGRKDDGLLGRYLPFRSSQRETHPAATNRPGQRGFWSYRCRGLSFSKIQTKCFFWQPIAILLREARRFCSLFFPEIRREGEGKGCLSRALKDATIAGVSGIFSAERMNRFVHEWCVAARKKTGWRDLFFQAKGRIIKFQVVAGGKRRKEGGSNFNG